MAAGVPVVETLYFLDFELTLARRELLRSGRPVAIGGRALELLALLATHPGEVLSNRILMQRVWPNMVVEEVNVRVQITALRKLFAGEAHCPYIVNLAGRGYCFTAPVTRASAMPLLRLHGLKDAGDPAASSATVEASDRSVPPVH